MVNPELTIIKCTNNSAVTCLKLKTIIIIAIVTLNLCTINISTIWSSFNSISICFSRKYFCSFSSFRPSRLYIPLSLTSPSARLWCTSPTATFHKAISFRRVKIYPICAILLLNLTIRSVAITSAIFCLVKMRTCTVRLLSCNLFASKESLTVLSFYIK
jgi:hypothetical protein